MKFLATLGHLLINDNISVTIHFWNKNIIKAPCLIVGDPRVILNSAYMNLMTKGFNSLTVLEISGIEIQPDSKG